MAREQTNWSRESAAEFIRANSDLVVARIRRQLGGGVRKYFDSQDVYSTVVRRVDSAFFDGKVRAADEGQLLGYVMAVVRTAIIDKSRVATRLANLQGENSEWARQVFGDAYRESDGETPELDLSEVARVTEAIENPEDRLILTCWLNGLNHRQTADALGLEWEAVRWRWRRIKEKLRRAAGEAAA